MVKHIYANGDSWTFGNGLEEDPLFKSSAIEYKQLEYTWPAFLGKLMNADVINESTGGGSNARMVRKTATFLRNFPEEKRDDLLVVLGWTSVERSEVPVSYEGKLEWNRLNAWQPFSEQWGENIAPWPSHVMKDIERYQKTNIQFGLNEKICLELFFRQIYLLSNMLESMRIKFLFFLSINGLTFPGTKINIDSDYKSDLHYLSDERFMGMHVGASMSAFCNQNNFPLSTCIHPLIKGHQAWGEYLYEHYNRVYQHKPSTNGDNLFKRM